MHNEQTSTDILCVDDEPDFAELTASYLERFDDQFTTTVETNAEDALEFLHENHVDCIVSDYNMPGTDGLAFLQAVRTTDPELPFMLFTGRGSEEIASDAISAGVTDYMQKGSGEEVYTLLGQRVSNNVRRYKSRREKREVETRAETILNACPDAIVVSVDDEFVYANPKASDLYGVPDSASLLGRNVEDFIHPDYRDTIDRKLQSVQSGGRSADHIPRTLFTIGDEEVPVEVTARHVSWEGEAGAVAIVRDLTERRRPELSPGRFRALFEQANDAIALVEFQDDSPIIQEANSSFESLFAPDEDVVGRDIDEVVTSGERVAEAKEISQQTVTGELVREELTRDTVEGPRDFLWQRVPLDDDQTGKIESAFAVYTDITERKRQSRHLGWYRRVVDAIGDPVYELDSEGQFTAVNDSLVELTGYDESTLLGEPASMVMDEDDFEKGTEVIRSLLQTDAERGTFEMDVITKAGTRIRCENQVALLPFEDEPRGSVGVLRNITDRLQRERELRRERDRLDEFAGVVSHDLRNPLKVASGRLDLAKAECESEHLDKIETALSRMETLIDDVLALARMGEKADEIERVSLEALVDTCWDHFELTDATLLNKPERTIEADQSRLQQLLENLFRNAVEHGGQDVRITVGELSDGFYVADDGPGIPPDERANIFDADHTSKEDGTGLGLSIVNRVVEAHGWDITVTASEAGGARFEITGV